MIAKHYQATPYPHRGLSSEGVAIASSKHPAANGRRRVFLDGFRGIGM